MEVERNRPADYAQVVEEDVRTCPNKASCNECGHFMCFELAGDFIRLDHYLHLHVDVATRSRGV